MTENIYEEHQSKGLLSRPYLFELVEAGVIENSLPEHMNQTSIDITLGDTIMREVHPDNMGTVVAEFRDLHEVSLRGRDPLNMTKVTVPDNGIVLAPGEFILACSEQIFNLPLDITAQYALKSSMARIGLEHLNAGFCDPGWYGSALTLELKNVTRFHKILLHKGDRIGQMLFFHHYPVDEAHSYAKMGRYNGDKTVAGVKL
jgi:dCTP deaminase